MAHIILDPKHLRWGYCDGYFDNRRHEECIYCVNFRPAEPTPAGMQYMFDFERAE